MASKWLCNNHLHMSTMPNLFQSYKHFVSKSALLRFYIILNCLTDTSQKKKYVMEPYPHMGQHLLKNATDLPFPTQHYRKVLSSVAPTFFFFFSYYIRSLVFFFSEIILFYMSLITGKPVFGFFDQVRLKPACTASEIS